MESYKGGRMKKRPAAKRGKGRMSSKPAPTIDQYIEDFPKGVQRKLHQMRRTIAKAAPEAREAISYRIPTFKLSGNLVHFAAFSDHIGFYPTSSGVENFKKDLVAYETSRGTIRFPMDEPLPLDLVARIVTFRVVENTKRRSRARKR